MPFRARAPFLRSYIDAFWSSYDNVSMPFRARAPFLLIIKVYIKTQSHSINALSGQGSISTNKTMNAAKSVKACINALSGQGSISTWFKPIKSTAKYMYQCPFGLGLHFYVLTSEKLVCTVSYQCPFGLGLHFYFPQDLSIEVAVLKYQCPFGLGLHFYLEHRNQMLQQNPVSMPFRARAPFLPTSISNDIVHTMVRVSMPFRARTPFLRVGSVEDGIHAYKYQCPFGLGLHFYTTQTDEPQSPSTVSMPFRARAPFLRYPFKNLGFMRFLEPIFAGIYQNILTMAIFRAC